MSGFNTVFVCLLVCFNASCFLTGWCQKEILLLYIIQDPSGEKGDASPAPLQCFGTANHGQRQNESILDYQLPPMTAGKASGAASRSVLVCVFPAKCPSCNPSANGRWHLTMIKTHSLCLCRAARPQAGRPSCLPGSVPTARRVLSLLPDGFCPSCPTGSVPAA